MKSLGLFLLLLSSDPELPLDMLDPGMEAPSGVSGIPAVFLWGVACVAVLFVVCAIWIFRRQHRRLAASEMPDAFSREDERRSAEYASPAPRVSTPSSSPGLPGETPDILPVPGPTAPSVPSPDHPGVSGREASVPKRFRVLVAEDIESNFLLFETVLRDAYEVLHAWNGREAVDMYREERPDLILMDINMPELDGYGATREIRMLSADVPIIAVTAYAYAEDKRRILSSGFTAYISKPVTPLALRRQVADALK